MTLNNYLQQSWHRLQEDKEAWKSHLMQWRREDAVLRLEHPTRLDRAHALGYRAKQGILVMRVRVLRGGHTRPDRSGGGSTKHMRKRLALRKGYRHIAEERAAKKYTNCEVLNSYFLAKDGKHDWYEVILVDRAHPVVMADHRLRGLAQRRGRVFRGITAAGRRTRGLRWKGKGVEKARPSRRAHKRLL